jgi:hypothetical protein
MATFTDTRDATLKLVVVAHARFIKTTFVNEPRLKKTKQKTVRQVFAALLTLS